MTSSTLHSKFLKHESLDQSFTLTLNQLFPYRRKITTVAVKIFRGDQEW